jgi:uncharacterized protein YxjI
MTDVIGGVDLTADRYVITQRPFRNRYKITDAEGDVVLKTKQKLFKLKEEFPFLDSDGNVVFRVKAESMLDFAGDYTLIDESSGEPIAVLEKQFTFFKHVWRVRSPDDRLLATIESGSLVIEVMRNLSGLFSIIPHSYTIEGPSGAALGTLDGRLSIRDIYDLHIEDPGDAPKEALVAAAIAIDALEGN